MTKKNDVAVSDVLLTGNNDITFDMEDLGDLGFEGETRSMSSIPVAKLTQAMTPEVKSRDYKDIYAGMFINDSTKVPLGDDFTFRPIRVYKCRMKFAPRDSGVQIECSCPTYDPQGATDRGSEHGLCARCMFNRWEQTSKEDRCQVQQHMIVAINDDPNQLMRIILSKSSFKASRKIMKLIRDAANAHRGLPIFCYKFKAIAKEEVAKSGNNSWFIWDFENAPLAEGEPLLPADKKNEFVEVFKDIKELYEETIEEHKKRVAASSAVEPSGVSNDMSSVGSSIAEELGMTGSITGEEVPF